MGDPSNIGMMEGAFFVGRTELLNWVNETLQLNVSKVEQCCTGAIYAQIIDAIHPGKVVGKAYCRPSSTSQRWLNGDLTAS